MTTRATNLTLPEELVVELRARAERNEIPSMSSYVAHIIAEHFQREADDEQRRANVEAYINEHLLTPDEASDAWASDVLDSISTFGRDR